MEGKDRVLMGCIGCVRRGDREYGRGGMGLGLGLMWGREGGREGAAVGFGGKLPGVMDEGSEREEKGGTW